MSANQAGYTNTAVWLRQRYLLCICSPYFDFSKNKWYNIYRKQMKFKLSKYI